MADQILSQEEVDALLSSITSGDVDFSEDEETKEEMRGPSNDLPIYDLTSQTVMMREQFEVLDEVFDRFTNSLRNSMTNSLRMPIEAELSPTEMVKFGEFLEGLSNPTSFHTFRMEPLLGSAMLAIEANLVFFLIDSMFGGKGKQIKMPERDLTLIEQRVMKKFASEVLADLEKAWLFVQALRFSISKSETKVQFVRLVAPSEPVFVVPFSIMMEEFSGNMWLCIPYLLLEPVKDKLSYKNVRDVELENAWSKQLRQLLDEAEVTVAAELGRATNTIRDILNLQAGDIVRLDSGPEVSIPVKVENVPKFTGFPGNVRNNRAVQIEGFFDQ